MGEPESRIEERLRQGVKALGGKAYKFVSPGNNGVPDRVVCLPNGKVFFAELKSPNGVLSEQQQHRIAELRKLNQKVYVFWSIQQVEKFLTELRGEIYK